MRPAIGRPMNWKRNERSESNKTGANLAPVFAVVGFDAVAPRNFLAAQRRMFAKQAALRHRQPRPPSRFARTQS
jgi:hypothetical protein